MFARLFKDSKDNSMNFVSICLARQSADCGISFHDNRLPPFVVGYYWSVYFGLLFQYKNLLENYDKTNS